jgi:hypothetical protein
MLGPPAMARLLLAIAAAYTLAGCTLAGLDEAASDGRDDGFDVAGGGKADGGLTAGQVAAVLALVNRASLAELDDEAGLDRRAAAGIVAHRDGADRIAGTADDDPFDDLAELDAVPWVGPVALARLLDHAEATGGACLIISQYLERWGNYNKAIELHNCGAAPVVLAAVRVCLVRNADRACTLVADLGDAVLAPGAVTTVCRRKTAHPAGNDPIPELAARCDLERPGAMSFDGDDRLLVLASDGAVLDALGQVGYQPPPGTWAEVDLQRCDPTPADGVSFYDHRDFFREVRTLDLAAFGQPPDASGCDR